MLKLQRPTILSFKTSYAFKSYRVLRYFILFKDYMSRRFFSTENIHYLVKYCSFENIYYFYTNKVIIKSLYYILTN